MPFGCCWFLNNPSIVSEITCERLELLGPSFFRATGRTTRPFACDNTKLTDFPSSARRPFRSRITTWLHRLTVNLVLMHFRKRHVRSEQLTDEGELPDEILIGRNNSNQMPVLDRFALDEAIVQLPPGYRMVFVLHDVKGLEHSEIALRLGCSIGTSKSQLHRARMRLRVLLRRRAHSKKSTEMPL